MNEADKPARRKDLQGLLNLDRAPVLSYFQKQSQTGYAQLAAFMPQLIWRWLGEYIRFRIGPKHPFLSYGKDSADNGVYRLQPTDGPIRIGLAGDWGTGTDEAALVAEQIKTFDPHYSIHLGDVYYVGTTHEVEENFLGLEVKGSAYHPCAWPSGSQGTFALNGNHEMLARGFGYFDHMLPRLGLRDSSSGQTASYFCLENEHWRIIALDTGYNSVGLPIIEYFFPPDCALRPEQLDWLRDIVRPDPGDPRGIIILSHHQYYSRYDDCFTKAAEQLAAFFHRPILWFWGHEHRLAIYEQGKIGGGLTAFGRCIGHGGMPVDLRPPTPKHDYAVEFMDDRHYPNDEGITVGFNGLATMTLARERLEVSYLDLRGTKVFAEVWSVSNGVLARVS